MIPWRLTIPHAIITLVCASCAATTASAPPPAGWEVTPPAAAPMSAADCRRPEGFGPVIVSPDQYASRTGAVVRTFAALSTSKERPLEECGLKTVLRRLATLRCNDDSNPFDGDIRAAHASRVGSMGAGGRCDAIIDRYAVKCPETTYRVFADMYFCSETTAKKFMGTRSPWRAAEYLAADLSP